LLENAVKNDEAHRAIVVFGNKVNMFEYKEKVGIFGIKKDGISGELKEEAINEIKLKYYLNTNC
ncbi:35658_t:CDS:2, partial [Gigaspora margarita]